MITIKNNHKKTFALIIIFSTSLFISSITYQNNLKTNFGQIYQEIEDKIGIKSSYFNNTASPIFINDSASGIDAHNWSWALEQPWCVNRSGIYYIENLTIYDEESSFCMSIINSDVEFKIVNCSFYSNAKYPVKDIYAAQFDFVLGLNSKTYGIELTNVSNGQIMNCSFIDLYTGITISDSINISIINCHFENNYLGIILYDAEQCYILNNEFKAYNYYGLGIHSGNNNTIKYNQFNDCICAIYLSGGSAYNKILYNEFFENNTIGVMLTPNYGSIHYNNFSGNNMTNCGFYFLPDTVLDPILNNYIDNTNKINEKTVYYFENKTYLKSSNFADPGQIILLNCNHSIINNISLFNGTVGIQSLFSYNITLDNINITNMKYYGIDTTGSINVTITNNALNNTSFGIFLNYMNISKIINNIINNCKIGISIGNPLLFYSTQANYYFNINISNNIMYGCGICMANPSLQACSTIQIDSENLIDGKPVYFYFNKSGLEFTNQFNIGQILLISCNHSSLENLTIGGGSIGISLDNCMNFTIKNCSSIENKISGFLIKNSNNIKCFNNTSNLNLENGIQLFQCDNCSLINNNIYHNNDMGSYTNIFSLFPNSGIEINTCTKTILNENNIGNNSHGIIVLNTGDQNINISKNKIDNNGDYGIFLVNSDYANVTKNDILNNGVDGILTFYCENNRIIGNKINKNNRNGLTFISSDNSDIMGNILNDNNGYYSFELSSVNNSFTWNIINNQCPSFTIDNEGSGNFTWSQAEENLAWCSGSGIAFDPYVIEDITINGLNQSNGIIIKNSADFFIIRNCLIFNSSTDGIKLTNVNNSNIINNDCSNNKQVGIGIYGKNLSIPSKNNNISNNICDNNYGGILLSVSNDNKIFNNSIDNNPEGGIMIYGSNNNISKNTMTKTGFIFIGFDSIEQIQSNNVDSFNTFNGKPIYFYCNRIGLNNNDFLNPGQIILINCNESAISNLNLSNGYYDIWIFSGYNNNLTNLITSYNLYYGIIVQNCNNTRVIDCTTNHNQFAGIAHFESNFTKISGCQIKNNQIGISFRYSYQSEISCNNIAYNSQQGLNIFDCENNLIYNNIFNQNGEHVFTTNDLNNWNNSNIGNYWDNYNGIDIAPFDGIGDVPYNVSQTPFVQDFFPIKENPSFNGSKIFIDELRSDILNWTQIALIKWWCSGSGTTTDPYILDNLIINGNGIGSCILINNSVKFFIIRNCNLYNSGNNETDAGIRLNNVNNSQILNNNCSYNNYNGIYLKDCNRNTISGNTINNNKYGIYLLNSHLNEISDNKNTINDNDQAGIYLIESDYNDILRNKINLNYYGVYFYHSNYNNIIANDLTNNKIPIWEIECVGNYFSDNILPPDDLGSSFLFILIILIISSVIGFSVGLIYIRKKKLSKNDFSKIMEIEKQEKIEENDIIPLGDISKDSSLISHKKSKTFIEERDSPLTPFEIEDLKKTESELKIDETKYICVVHKGIIDGAVYICPICKAFYCVRCVNALKEKGENCWFCNSPITID